MAHGTVQQWHHHEAIEETLFIISGDLEARWRDGTDTMVEHLGAGDIERVGRSVHTFANTGTTDVQFVVFRLVLDGTDKRELIKNDKVVDEQ